MTVYAAPPIIRTIGALADRHNGGGHVSLRDVDPDDAEAIAYYLDDVRRQVIPFNGRWCEEIAGRYGRLTVWCYVDQGAAVETVAVPDAPDPGDPCVICGEGYCDDVVEGASMPVHGECAEPPEAA